MRVVTVERPLRVLLLQLLLLLRRRQLQMVWRQLLLLRQRRHRPVVEKEGRGSRFEQGQQRRRGRFSFDSRITILHEDRHCSTAARSSHGVARHLGSRFGAEQLLFRVTTATVTRLLLARAFGRGGRVASCGRRGCGRSAAVDVASVEIASRLE